MKANNIITIVAIVALVIAVIFLSVNKLPISETEKETLSATGTSSIKVLPDLAKIHISIETLSDSAEQSKEENNRITEQVTNELYNIGISRSEVQTQNFNVYPDYEYYPRQKLKGFKTTNSLVITTTDFIKVGQIVDAAVNGGATRINNIQFELSEEKQAETKKEALKKASEDAREKALSIAEGLNVKLGKLKSVSSQDYYYLPYRAFEGATLAAEEAQSEIAKTTIIPTELETTATVIVAFEIR